jgi:hypothetical protein
MENFMWASIVLLICVFYLGYLLGKTKFDKFAFGNTEEPMYSFRSGDTLEETIEKIEAIVKENARLHALLKKLITIEPSKPLNPFVDRMHFHYEADNLMKATKTKKGR